jgi:hypothetical protein
MSTPAWSLEVAIEQALTQDPAVVQFIGPEGVYNGVVPSKVPKPYVMIDTGLLSDVPMFNNSRYFDGALYIHIWARNKREVIQIFNSMFAVLNRKPILMEDGFTLVSGKLSLQAAFLDEDNVSFKGVAMFDSLTV